MKTTVETIKSRMVGQDNRITSHPIYVVRQRSTIEVGDAGDDHLSCVWYTEGGEVAGATEEDAREFANDNDLDFNSFKLYDTIIIWEWVQPFFSLKGAEKYIEENRHNLECPHVYVASGYRNDEWQAIRKMLLSENQT